MAGLSLYSSFDRGPRNARDRKNCGKLAILSCRSAVAFLLSVIIRAGDFVNLRPDFENENTGQDQISTGQRIRALQGDYNWY